MARQSKINSAIIGPPRPDRRHRLRGKTGNPLQNHGQQAEQNRTEFRDIESRVQKLPDDQLLDRFHALVDKRLNQAITFLEEVELRSIDARFDSQDETEITRAVEFKDAWDRERSELIASIERLIAELKLK